jgi:hypothetical protein
MGRASSRRLQLKLDSGLQQTAEAAVATAAAAAIRLVAVIVALL